MQTFLLFLPGLEIVTLKLTYFSGLHWPSISSFSLILLTLEMEFESRLNNIRT